MVIWMNLSLPSGSSSWPLTFESSKSAATRLVCKIHILAQKCEILFVHSSFSHTFQRWLCSSEDLFLLEVDLNPRTVAALLRSVRPPVRRGSWHPINFLNGESRVQIPIKRCHMCFSFRLELLSAFLSFEFWDGVTGDGAIKPLNKSVT